MEYTLSIEDRIGTGVNCTERAVMVNGNAGPLCVTSYNPNKETGPFNSKGPFDTSFSIVHPFKYMAELVVLHNCMNEGSEKPVTMKYDVSVNDAQRTLFGNILRQEYDKAKQQNPVNPFILQSLAEQSE